jgi:hypothetical protein
VPRRIIGEQEFIAACLAARQGFVNQFDRDELFVG